MTILLDQRQLYASIVSLFPSIQPNANDNNKSKGATAISSDFCWFVTGSGVSGSGAKTLRVTFWIVKITTSFCSIGQQLRDTKLRGNLPCFSPPPPRCFSVNRGELLVARQISIPTTLSCSLPLPLFSQRNNCSMTEKKSEKLCKTWRESHS